MEPETHIDDMHKRTDQILMRIKAQNARYLSSQSMFLRGKRPRQQTMSDLTTTMEA